MEDVSNQSDDKPESGNNTPKPKSRPRIIKPPPPEQLDGLQQTLSKNQNTQNEKIASVSKQLDEPQQTKKKRDFGLPSLDELAQLDEQIELQNQLKSIEAKKPKKNRNFGLPTQDELTKLDQQIETDQQGNSKVKKKKRDFTLPSKDELKQLDQQIEEQVQEPPQRKRAGAIRAYNPQEQDVQWIVLPFEEGQNTLKASAEAYVKQRKNDPNSPRFIIVTHEPGNKYLSGVRPNHKVLLFAHGASGDSTNLYSGSDNPEGGKESMTGAQLATQMLNAGLNPNGVKIKLTTCYGGGTNNVTLDEAKQMDTLAKTFAEEIGNQSLERGRGLPTYVDGFVGKVSSNLGPISDKNSRRLTMGVQLDEDEQFAMLPVTLSDSEPSKAAKQESKKIAHKRAKHNRVRYNLQPTGNGGTVDVTLNEQDYERAEQARLDLETQKTLESIGGVKLGKWKQIKQKLNISL